MVLQALLDNHPALMKPSEILEFTPIEMAALTLDEVRQEIAGLGEHGFIKNVHPGREPWFKITAAGMDQIRRDSTACEYVWGEFASKFQE